MSSTDSTKAPEVTYDRDEIFGKTPHEGILCENCLDDNGYDTESIQMGYSTIGLLTCNRCGHTNVTDR